MRGWRACVFLWARLLVTLVDARADTIPSPQQTAQTELGRYLFYDADLSQDGSMSCATCHEQKHAFADGNKTHPGVTDDAGIRNVPSLANVGSFHTLTWIDQHLTTLQQQFFVPVFGHTPVEMGMINRQEMVARVAGKVCYKALFAKAFPDQSPHISSKTIAQAVAAFERTLVSRQAVWDLPDHGQSLQSETQKMGAALFFGKAHCSRCHAPPLFTDQKFYRLLATDRTLIRTPSLRNVQVTAPYFHDGSASTLKEAISAHASVHNLTEQETNNLTDFLQLLTDRTFLTNPAFSLPAQESR